MALFKILRGDSSKISTDITPFHDGWCYFTADDGGFYIDVTVNGENHRVRINPDTSNEKIPSEDGAYGLRYYNGTLQYDDNGIWRTLSIADLLI